MLWEETGGKERSVDEQVLKDGREGLRGGKGWCGKGHEKEQEGKGDGVRRDGVRRDELMREGQGTEGLWRDRMKSAMCIVLALHSAYSFPLTANTGRRHTTFQGSKLSLAATCCLFLAVYCLLALLTMHVYMYDPHE